MSPHSNSAKALSKTLQSPGVKKLFVFLVVAGLITTMDRDRKQEMLTTYIHPNTFYILL